MRYTASLIGIGLVLGCGRDIELGSDMMAIASRPGASQDAGAGASNTSCVETRCEGKLYACGDCEDNDADGLADNDDPECLGACDATEDSLYSGMLGQKDATCKVDCYFDGDNGSGNDDCHWSHRCDPLSLSPNYAPGGDAQCAYDALASVPGTALACDTLATTQSAQCLSTCLPLTPQGCDCFGCCEIPVGSGRAVWLGSITDGVGSCNTNSLDDPLRCRPCTRTIGCQR